MTPIFDPGNDRPAPVSYLKALPPEFINPCELVELEARIEKLRAALEKIANYGERTHDGRPNPNRIFVQAYNQEIFVIARKALEDDNAQN